MANIWTCDIPPSYLGELPGTSGAVGVLWYAVGTFIKYRREATYAIPGVTYELGYSYWFAVAGVVCVCAVGIMLLSVTCSTRKRMNKGKIHRATLLLTGHNNHMPTSPLPGHSKTYL
ncbi:hypothetical protein EOD39_16923 [Acipenser ruthenus]|uniref:Uncharacterized protein n=1 Tax=Acipenser ruthenus TaxID=7906 RepID=A0A444V4R8_ACIRT|nr:hypothetical protein EOD39_16923 [Acipenser ruthenus]